MFVFPCVYLTTYYSLREYIKCLTFNVRINKLIYSDRKWIMAISMTNSK